MILPNRTGRATGSLALLLDAYLQVGCLVSISVFFSVVV